MRRTLDTQDIAANMRISEAELGTQKQRLTAVDFSNT